MNLVFRIVFGIVVGVIFLSISFSTFVTHNQYATLPELNIDESQNLYTTGSLNYNNISKNESIYSNLDVSYSFSGTNLIVPLEDNGKYISSMRNIGASYNFSGTGYVISQKGIGEIYMDTLTEAGSVFVYSKNTPVEIDLVSNDATEIYTTMYLAPGMYVEFQPSSGQYLKNADRLRISTVYKLGYVSSLSSDDIDMVAEKYVSAENIFLIDALDHIDTIDRKKYSYLNFIGESDIPEVSGYSYIEKYLNLFINEEKKKVFYKNIVLSGYITLINTKTIDTDILNQVKKYEAKLKDIDENSYNEILLLKSDITSALYSQKNSEYISSKILFSELENTGLDHSRWLYPLYGFSLFSDEQQVDAVSEFITKSFFESFSQYMGNYTQTQTRYDYFLYFLEERLLFLLSSERGDSSIGSTLEILSNYISISTDAEYTEKNQKITQLDSVSKIIQAFDIFTRDTYFLAQRDSNNLLILQSKTSVLGNRLSEFQLLIKALFGMYEENEFLLNENSTRDAEIIQSILLAKSNTDEYIGAISNYGKYIEEYDVGKNTILSVDVIGNQEAGISEASGREYISQFIGVSQGGYTLSVIDDTYYKIENLVVSGQIFSFEIYPYSSHKLKNIIRDEEILTTQYTLDSIEYEWNDKYETAPEDRRDQYDFARFFILTFLSVGDSNAEIFVKEIQEQESKAEIVFKRDILLGDKGEFALLQDFLQIRYEDISLTQVGQDYNIFLNDVNFNVNDINSQERGNISGILHSEYILNQENHNFKNVKLQIESEQKGTGNEVDYELGGTPVTFVGTTYIFDLESNIQEIIPYMNLYQSVYSVIENTGQVNDLVIEYTPINGKTRFKFDSAQKSFTIILQNGEITGIYSGTLKLASSPITPQDITNYLP